MPINYGYPGYTGGGMYGSGYYGVQPQQLANYPMQNFSGAQMNPYWVSVDGEMAARAWQMPNNLPPNSIVPLWDLDGTHVYFKSTDAYGRINPIRKGHVVFDDEMQQLPQGQSGASMESQVQNTSTTHDMNNFVTKDDFNERFDELKMMIGNLSQSRGPGVAQNFENAPNSRNINQTNQNGSKNSNRGDR